MTQHSELDSTALVAGSTQHFPKPLPSVNITIRPGVMSDIPFMDSLQKLHTKQVGWMPTKQFEGKIKAGHVLIAERVIGHSSLVIGEEHVTNDQGPMTNDADVRVGYCIGNDQYFKRDDVGIIYQMNVLPGKQRSFVGATLLKAMFDRAAYGCKLFCCWCAQDIAANKFWEAMGFVPLAYRAGSEKKSRVHIFWQKRIRSGDTTTPWWFPSQTSGGSIREDRIVLPIPPGTHWSDAKPLVLPGNAEQNVGPALPDESEVRQSRTYKKVVCRERPKAPKQRQVKTCPTVRPANTLGGLRFLPPAEKRAPVEKPKREPRRKAKNDPRLVAAARELRDRWLEQVNSSPLIGQGKYDVSRLLPGPGTNQFPMLLEETPIAA